MLPEILDENPETNIYPFNLKMRFVEGLIVIGNIFTIGWLQITNIFILLFVIPIFYVFCWNQIYKLCKQGIALNLDSFFFSIQRIAMLVMGWVLTLIGVIGFLFISAVGDLVAFFLIFFILGMGVMYLYHWRLVELEIHKFMTKREQS